MRVTDLTKREQVVRTMQDNEQKMQDLQGKLSSGQRITKTSDDPIGATLLQDIITTISRNDQMMQNIENNISYLERVETELSHVNDLLTKGKTQVVAQAGDSASPESRRIVAQELRALSEAIYKIANARQGKLFLFSGTKTLTSPLQRNEKIHPAKVSMPGMENNEFHQLLAITDFAGEFDGYSSNHYRVRITETGILGKAKYQVSDDDGLTWGTEKILLPNIDVFNEEGKPDDKVVLRLTAAEARLNQIRASAEGQPADFDTEEGQVVFEEGLEFVFNPNPPISYKGNSQKKQVLIANGITVPINFTAEEIFMGTDTEGVNIFETLSALEKALDNNDRDAVSQRLDDMENGLLQILQIRAEIGNRMNELEDAKFKLEENNYSRTKRRSELQDIQMAESIVDLKTTETNSQVSRQVGASLLQPSLINFVK